MQLISPLLVQKNWFLFQDRKLAEDPGYESIASTDMYGSSFIVKKNINIVAAPKGPSLESWLTDYLYSTRVCFCTRRKADAYKALVQICSLTAGITSLLARLKSLRKAFLIHD